jgi:myo-inositol-1(or 4)-monophosphatase
MPYVRHHQGMGPDLTGGRSSGRPWLPRGVAADMTEHAIRDEIGALALEAAHAGASAIRSTMQARSLDPHEKANNQGLVTNADYASESAIIHLIRERRRDDAFLAEESGEMAGTSGVRWVIDPLAPVSWLVRS